MIIRTNSDDVVVAKNEATGYEEFSLLVQRQFFYPSVEYQIPVTRFLFSDFFPAFFLFCVKHAQSTNRTPSGDTKRQLTHEAQS